MVTFLPSVGPGKSKPTFRPVLSSVHLTSPVLLLPLPLSCMLAVSKAHRGRWCIKKEAAVEVEVDLVIPVQGP